MQKIRYGLIVLSLLFCSANFAAADVSIGIGLPNVSIGINLPLFPQLVRVPGYPVYYAPQMDANYFFYDGMYWVYQDDNWYASSWYNGPWGFVEPEYVPLFILRVPVSYYRQPPVYFRSWQSNAPPRWGQHWGHEWERHRSGWDRWNRRSAPAPAPLPVYQRKYSGDRYPRAEQQHQLRKQQYRYQPRDKVVRQHLKQQAGQKAPAAEQRRRRETPAARTPQQDQQRSPQHQQVVPGGQRPQPQHQAPPRQRAPAVQEQRPQPGAEQRQQQPPRARGQEQRSPDRGESQEQNRGHGQGQNKGDDRGQGHNKDEDRGRGRNN